jgi:thiosulfate reductase/polysulfide reductase chain A
LESFVSPYTPEWASEETGIDANEIVAFAHEVAADAPAVIFHPGWLTARYRDSFYACRTAYILNVLMGSIEAPGGLFFSKGTRRCRCKRRQHPARYHSQTRG